MQEAVEHAKATGHANFQEYQRKWLISKEAHNFQYVQAQLAFFMWVFKSILELVYRAKLFSFSLLILGL